ncbi:MAG: hypothetical protein LWW79_11610 [Holophagaceae bacterium]|nr:hypothetical protein [Holophagaceae bacterium]
MKKTVFAAVLLLAGPLAAQDWELGIFAGQQGYRSSQIPGVDEPKSKPAFIGRMGFSAVDLGPVLLQVTTGLHTATDTIVGTGAGDKTFHSHTHVSLGAMFNVKALVAFGAGVEYRFERLDVQNSGVSHGNDVTFNRPWVRANLGMAFPTPVMKPFVGLEVAVPLVNKSAGASSSMEDQIRSLAPKYQVGLYGGFRF